MTLFGRRSVTAAVFVVAAATVLVLVLSRGDGRAADGPLEAPPPHGYSAVAERGRTFTDGFEVLRLNGDRDAVIEAIRMVGSDGLTLVGARLVPPDRGFASVQADKHWPPRDRLYDGVELVDAVGATITPLSEGRAGWELLLGVKVVGQSEAPLIRDGIEIDYRVGDESYTTYRPAQLVVCTAADQVGEDGFCPLPED